MRTCKQCGADISHLRKGTFFCRQKDNPDCYRARKAKSEKERQHRNALKRGRYCPCGTLLISKNARACSPECLSKLKATQVVVRVEPMARKKKRKLKEAEVFGVPWPYEMKMFDRDVTPADVCPMG